MEHVGAQGDGQVVHLHDSLVDQLLLVPFVQHGLEGLVRGLVHEPLHPNVHVGSELILHMGTIANIHLSVVHAFAMKIHHVLSEQIMLLEHQG